MKKIKVLPSECDCEKCSQMCQASCCGTPEDINKLIEAGYADRLMLDDWPGDADILKPALKGYESESAPWEVATKEGCTFWKNGKCELHISGLKPTQGKLALHSLSEDQEQYISELLRDSWNTILAEEIIEKWKKITKYKDDNLLST